MVGLTDGEENFEDMYNRLNTIPVCDRQMDGHTSCDGIVRAMHTRRAIKMSINRNMLITLRKAETEITQKQKLNVNRCRK